VDPDPYPFQPNVKLNYTFSIRGKEEKDETMLTGTAVILGIKVLKNSRFSSMCKTWGRIRIWI
jgi:hypothetical protein